MRARTMQGVTVLRRVRDFLQAREIATAMGPITKHIETLAGIIDRLTAHAVEQESRERAAKAGTNTKHVTERVLRGEFMRPIAGLARSMFPGDASAVEALSMPPFRDHERTLASAYAMVDRVTQHKAAYVSRGFPEDFVDKFRAAADAFKVAIDARSIDVGRRAASTAGQLEELRRGRALVRLLDTMVAPRLVTQPDLAAEWRSLVRFRPRPAGAEEVPVVVAPADGEVKAAA